jgi:hypothetical protein
MTTTRVTALCGQKNTSTIKLGGSLDYPQLELTLGLCLLHVNPSPWRPARKQGGLHVHYEWPQGNNEIFPYSIPLLPSGHLYFFCQQRFLLIHYFLLRDTSMVVNMELSCGVR